MPAHKAGIGTALLALAALGVYILTRDDRKSPPEPTAQSSGADDTSGTQGNPDPSPAQSNNDPDPVTIQSERSDLEQTDQEFAEEEAKLISLSNEDRYGPYKAEIDSLVQDAEVFREMTRSAFGACINSSTDATVFRDCLRDQAGFRQSWTALLVGDLLSKLPDISKAHMRTSCDDNLVALSKRRADTGSLLDKLMSDPNAAPRYGKSIGELESLSKKAAEYQGRAQAAEDSDLVLSYLLINHSNLMLAEIGWHTWDYNMTISHGQPRED